MKNVKLTVLSTNTAASMLNKNDGYVTRYWLVRAKQNKNNVPLTCRLNEKTPGVSVHGCFPVHIDDGWITISLSIYVHMCVDVSGVAPGLCNVYPCAVCMFFFFCLLSVEIDADAPWSNSRPFLHLYFPLIHLSVSVCLPSEPQCEKPVLRLCVRAFVSVCVHVCVCATASCDTMIKCFE